MKLIMLMTLSCSLALSMEQPSPVAQLQNYTLVSKDGKEITLDGDWVREYLPGLAERVGISTKHGMSEGAGKVTIKDLDEQALLNLKSLLVDYSLLKRAFDQQKEQMGRSMSTEDYLNNTKVIDKRLREQMILKIEKLPHIKDHYLVLFKEMIGWQMPVIIEEAMAQFSAYSLSPEEAYELFKDLDPTVQLLYLSEADFTIFSVMKVLEWATELENNPFAQSIENRELFAKLRTKVIDFLVKNKLFPATIIRPGKGWPGATPYISDLGDQIIALHDNSQIKNIYDFKKDGFKNLKWISSPKRDIGYVFWNPDKLIIYEEASFDVYDINTSKLIFAPSMTKRLKISPIRQIVPISNDQLLIVDKSHTVYKLTIKADKSYSIEPILNNVLDIVKINDNEYISVDRYQGTLRLTLRKINNGEIIKELPIVLANYSLNSLKKISNNELGMVLTPAQGDLVILVTLKYIIVSIPDLKLTAVEDFTYTYRPGQYHNYKFIPMNAHRILIKEFSPEKTNIYFYDVVSKAKTPLEKFSSAVVLNQNNIAVFDQRTNNFEMQFFPQSATFTEILAEIHRKIAPQLQQPKQSQPAPKRPAPPALEAPTIPAAAKGLKPEARESKRPREEKEKPNE